MKRYLLDVVGTISIGLVALFWASMVGGSTVEQFIAALVGMTYFKAAGGGMN